MRIGRRIKPQANGCWLYEGGRQRYAQVWTGHDQMPAHRYVYEILVGEIPEDHVLHHVCETPRCVNPDHLEPMTNSEHLAHHRQLRRAG